MNCQSKIYSKSLVEKLQGPFNDFYLSFSWLFFHTKTSEPETGRIQRGCLHPDTFWVNVLGSQTCEIFLWPKNPAEVTWRWHEKFSASLHMLRLHCSASSQPRSGLINYKLWSELLVARVCIQPPLRLIGGGYKGVQVKKIISLRNVKSHQKKLETIWGPDTNSLHVYCHFGGALVQDRISDSVASRVATQRRYTKPDSLTKNLPSKFSKRIH